LLLRSKNLNKKIKISTGIVFIFNHPGLSTVCVRNFLHLLVVTATVLGISAEVDITVVTVLVNCLVVALGVNCVDCCELNDAPGGSDVVKMLCLWAARQRRPFFSYFTLKEQLHV